MLRKAIAFDVMSMFHLYSVVACFNSMDAGRLTIYLLRGLNGKYCCEKGDFEIGGKLVSVRYQEEFLLQKSKSLLFLNGLMFLLGRVIRVKSDPCYILHHTYFKPTCLKFFTASESFRLNPIGFEEGIGTYGDLKHYREVAKRENKSFPLLSLVLKKTLSLFLTRKFSVLGPEYNASDAIDFKRAVGVVINWQAHEDVRLELEELECLGRKVVILFMSPYMDMYGVSEDSFIRAINRIMASYKDYEVVVKPHPLEYKSLEVYEKMGLKYIRSNISGEALIYLMQPYKTIGFYSGSLLVSRNVFDIGFEVFGGGSDDYGPVLPSPSILKLFG
ncbi:polysialyltransferase family glycosyltransferase [Pseudomonas putida]|uniref:polysialyltransferase family glycosyltransferase n=1 Tax=Pseudomonas putida TaxID=303 RepID=UPI00117A451E|nr:polysialyltransferase family glycosyltransferase [Pseudomonas putida]